jgi:hypothetical protein
MPTKSSFDEVLMCKEGLTITRELDRHLGFVIGVIIHFYQVEAKCRVEA